MTLTIDAYEQGKTYIECRYDKYAPHYHCVVYADDGMRLIKDLSYSTKEEAIRSFKRQVAKAKKEEIYG